MSDDTAPSDQSREAESGMTGDGGPPDMEADAASRRGRFEEQSDAGAAQGSPEAEPELMEASAPRADLAAEPPSSEELGPLRMASELERVRKERQEFLDGWQRARAEFANYRKRVEREQEEARGRIAGETLLRVLAVLDDLERALKDRPAEGDAAAWSDGIELIYRKFQALLEAEGVEPIQAEGRSFDPALHEALSHEESEQHGEGDVIEVVQRGYRIGDRVLRPALVRVAK